MHGDIRTEQQPATSAPAFKLRNVRQVKQGVRVLEGIDLKMPAGQITALIGPSGAGKSSLIRLLNRLDSPVAGEVRYHARPVDDYPVRELRRRVGCVFQTPVMFPGTVFDNLREAARIAGVNEATIALGMEEALRIAELDPSLGGREAERLSVGQKQRVNLARALMTAPESLLLDEPTSALDLETADRLMDTLRHLNTEKGLTIVIATHRLREAARASDYTVMLDQGRVVEANTTREIFERSTRPRTRAFLDSGK